MPQPTAFQPRPQGRVAAVGLIRSHPGGRGAGVQRALQHHPGQLRLGPALDLLLAAEPAHIPAITRILLKLGFQPQLPVAFPATRPMLWGAFRHRSTDYRVHVHVVPASSPEVAAMRGFRDALRADPLLRRRYAALKQAIVEGGPVDPVAFTKAKHDWIVAALGQLGLVSTRNTGSTKTTLAGTNSTNWPHELAQTTAPPAKPRACWSWRSHPPTGRQD